VAKSFGSESSEGIVIHLARSQNVYFLTGRGSEPVISGEGLAASAFPAYIFRHRSEWILYAGTDGSARLNGDIIILGRHLLKDGDVLAVGESGPLLFRDN